MYHLVKFDYILPTICYSCRSLRALKRFFNSLDVPPGGLSYEVYDLRGRHVGTLVRFHKRFRHTFLKSRRYAKKDYGFIYFALKASKMDACCRDLLDCVYPRSAGSDVLRFLAEDFD